MRISILTPDVSQNCLGRAWVLAEMLRRKHEVEIIGPMFGRGIWPPLAHSTIPIRAVRGNAFPFFFLEVLRLARLVRGDVVYASKPLLTSYGMGLLIKLLRKKKLVLDIDDWELAFKTNPGQKRCLSLAPLRELVHIPNSYLSTSALEAAVSAADYITVSGPFLQAKFGGDIIWHARDTDRLDPARYDSGCIRGALGIPRTKRVITFIGTPRPNKGLEDLIAAVSAARHTDVALMLVGLDRSDYSTNIADLAKERLRGRAYLFPPQQIEQLPRFLAAADIVAVPQREHISSVGQTPAKIFDAMAMAKPIVATRVADIPQILEGCAWLVEPNSPDQLANAFMEILAHSENAAAAGQRARCRCIERYSIDAVSEGLLEIFRQFE